MRMQVGIEHGRLRAVRRQPHGSILYRTIRVLEGTSVFGLTSLLLVGALFVLGNYQQFLDTSLMLLLRLMSALSLLCVASGACYVVGLLVWMIRRRHVMVVRLLYGLVATAVGAAGAIGTGLLQAMAQPV